MYLLLSVIYLHIGKLYHEDCRDRDDRYKKDMIFNRRTIQRKGNGICGAVDLL
jgi:hypothetical protein